MSENSVDLAGDYLQAVREAVVSGLDKADAPLPGFFRKRSKEAVYSQLTDEIMAELEPVVRMAVSVASEPDGDQPDEAVSTDRTAAIAGEQGAYNMLRTIHDDLNGLDRTPRRALEIVERRMREVEERETRRVEDRQSEPAVLDEEPWEQSDG